MIHPIIIFVSLAAALGIAAIIAAWSMRLDLGEDAEYDIPDPDQFAGERKARWGSHAAAEDAE